MAYSHTWVVRNRNSVNVEAIATDAKALADNAGIDLKRSSLNDRPPTFGPMEIRFNARQNGCEDFQYPPHWDQNADRDFPPGFGWCKTNSMPYDVMVAATLLAIKHHLEDDVVARSDGAPDSGPWRAAIDLYRLTFPERTPPILDNWPGGSGREE